MLPFAPPPPYPPLHHAVINNSTSPGSRSAPASIHPHAHHHSIPSPNLQAIVETFNSLKVVALEAQRIAPPLVA